MFLCADTTCFHYEVIWQYRYQTRTMQLQTSCHYCMFTCGTQQCDLTRSKGSNREHLNILFMNTASCEPQNWVTKGVSKQRRNCKSKIIMCLIKNATCAKPCSRIVNQTTYIYGDPKRYIRCSVMFVLYFFLYNPRVAEECKQKLAENAIYWQSPMGTIYSNYNMWHA